MSPSRARTMASHQPSSKRLLSDHQVADGNAVPGGWQTRGRLIGARRRLRLLGLARHRLTGELQLLDNLAVEASPDRWHETAPGRVLRPGGSFLASSARTSPSALQTARFIALAALATSCRGRSETGRPVACLLVPAQDDQVRASAICFFRHDCPPGTPKGASGPLSVEHSSLE